MRTGPKREAPIAPPTKPLSRMSPDPAVRVNDCPNPSIVLETVMSPGPVEPVESVVEPVKVIGSANERLV